jgi:hypothetical protein
MKNAQYVTLTCVSSITSIRILPRLNMLQIFKTIMDFHYSFQGKSDNYNLNTSHEVVLY